VQLEQPEPLQHPNKRLLGVLPIQWAIVRVRPIMLFRLATQRTAEKLQMLNKAIPKFQPRKYRLPKRA